MNKKTLENLLTLAIVDVATDIMFLNSVFAPKQKVKECHPLIGRRYIVHDNSYAIDKESGVEVSGLHGKEYIIVSEPYVEEITSFFGTTKKYVFVDVFSTDSERKYRVIFEENGVVKED